jgi:hypothetical protein
MQEEQTPKQPVRIPDESQKTPQPAKNAEAAPQVQDNFTIAEKENKTVVVPPARIQDLDWNNSKPESTPKDVDQLPSHKTAEAQNDEDLRENKGTKPGEHPMEASEEVNTGQTGG